MLALDVGETDVGILSVERLGEHAVPVVVDVLWVHRHENFAVAAGTTANVNSAASACGGWSRRSGGHENLLL